MTNLSFGGGCFDVLIDFENQDVVVYNGGDEFHGRFGGRQYYTSRSSLTGAGWIPSRLDRIVVRGYRTETEIPWAALTPIGGGFELGIPTYRDGIGKLADDFPALVRTARGLVLCHVRDLFAVLGGGTGTPHEYKFEFFAAAGEDHRVFCERYDYIGPDWWHKQHRNNAHAVLRALHREVFFQADGATLSLPFWTRLGLHWQTDGHAYKIAKGIAWRRYSPDDLKTQEQRQAAAPKNVLFLSDRHYLQRSHDGSYEAIGISRGRVYDYETTLLPDVAMRALMGDTAVVIAKLDHGIGDKIAVDHAAAAASV